MEVVTIKTAKVKEVFESKKDLNDCLKWWQEKLFLTDWIIRAKIVSPNEFNLGPDQMGENTLDLVNKCSIIRIIHPIYYGDCIMKYCAEKILVHELLHCKYNWSCDNDTYESNYVDTSEHSLLEQMAKSLIMAKYDLPFDYFIESQE